MEIASTTLDLSQEQIHPLLVGEAACCRIEYQNEVDSTNSALRRRAEAGERAGAVLIARRQTAGRGRLGRSFFSPDTTGLYFSLLLRPTFEAALTAQLTTAAAVAVSEAIAEVFGIETQIKWVNDLYLHGKKVCGILSEAALDGEAVRFAVVGIGINLSPPSGGFPPELADTAGALLPALPTLSQTAAFLASILNRFFALYSELPRMPHIPAYRSRSFLRGKRVTYTRGEETFCATVVDIDGQANLILRTDDGEEHAYSCGEISLHGGIFPESIQG